MVKDRITDAGRGDFKGEGLFLQTSQAHVWTGPDCWPVWFLRTENEILASSIPFS